MYLGYQNVVLEKRMRQDYCNYRNFTFLKKYVIFILKALQGVFFLHIFIKKDLKCLIRI